MRVRFYLIDSFASAPYSGNPAAVVVLEHKASEEWMRAVAAELNQPATAFVAPDDSGAYELRWLTATKELELCGHGTLAAAHALRESSAVTGSVSFRTRAGVLRAMMTEDGITLDFPALQSQPCEPPPALTKLLGAATPLVIRRTDLDYLIELISETEVRAATPDLDALATLPVRGLILSAAADADSEADFVSRFFAPASGIPEDAVTGSAHCALAPYWFRWFGRDELVGFQASTRGGYVRVARRGTDRVALSGRAITICEGTLAPPAARTTSSTG